MVQANSWLKFDLLVTEPLRAPNAIGNFRRAFFGVGPRSEFYAKIVRIDGNSEGVRSPSQIEPVQLGCGCPGPPHRNQIVVDDFFAGGDRLICAGKHLVLRVLLEISQRKRSRATVSRSNQPRVNGNAIGVGSKFTSALARDDFELCAWPALDGNLSPAAI
jgi:hypothetical protein